MGDRFIPTRSLMDMELARSLMVPMEKKRSVPDPSGLPCSSSRDEYRRVLQENLLLDSYGKPFRMMVFREKPAACPKNPFMEDKRPRITRQIRRLPKSSCRTLDGPNLADDYFLNILDWGNNNILAVALGPSVYIRHEATDRVQLLLTVNEEEDQPTSLSWSNDGITLAIGFASSRIELWDVTELCCVRTLEMHNDRVGSLSWNSNILTSGSRDTFIINHDVRIPGQPASYFHAHSAEVCGLKWSDGGNLLASGGNDRLVHVWEARRAPKYLYRLADHSAAVKALAWCPFQSNLLASGGWIADQCIKIWNTRVGTCSKSIDTGSPVSALQWNRHQKEIMSGHGCNKNQLSLWAYPSMSKITDFNEHTAGVLHLSQSPDGLTVVSAAADSTLRYWKVFEPSASTGTCDGDRESVLSLRRMHIR